MSVGTAALSWCIYQATAFEQPKFDLGSQSKRKDKPVLTACSRRKPSSNCLRFANPAEAATNPANMARIGAKLRQHAFRTICNFWFFDAEFFFRKTNIRFFFSENNSVSDRFFIISVDFGGARLVLTSKSASSRYFASDGRVLRPARGLEAMINDWWSMIDDYWLTTDDYNDSWFMTHDWWLMSDEWWLMTDDWLMINDLWLMTIG